MPPVAAPPSLEDLTKYISPEKLDQPCSDKHLGEIALSLTGWQFIAPFLGLSEVDEHEIVCLYQNNLVMQNIAMLRKWRTSCGHNATYTKLARVLLDCGKADLACKVCRLAPLTESNNISETEPTSSRNSEDCRMSLKEFLKNVPCEKLNLPCTNAHLKKIALLMTTDWQSIAPLLGITEAVEDEISCCRTVMRQKIAMFRRWKNRLGPKAKYQKLLKVFWELQHKDMCTRIVQILHPSSHDSGDSDSSSEDDETAEDKTQPESYSDYLRGRYKVQIPTFFSVQWPPTPTRKVFNLSMIQKETMNYGYSDDDELTRLMLRGNLKEILHRHTPVNLENIFKCDKGGRKVILIEGAPGAGKSTLAWDICQKWGSRDLFQQYRTVIYIQLRDPSTHSATTFADLIPAKNQKMASDTLTDLESCNGRDTLFVLDSWDELPLSLHIGTGSLFERLICYPERLNVHLSSIIVTSRPIASGDLQQYILSRIEIVGFTPTELKQYFSEVLDNSETLQKLQDHLKERPVIEASCYLPLNAAIVVHLFRTLNHSLPDTLHGVFTSLVLSCIIRDVKKGSFQLLESIDISSLDNLPPDIQQHFKNICSLAYHGVIQNKATFSAEDLQSFNLPVELTTLSLIQGAQSFTAFRKCICYNFLHLSVQELLAAYHISKMPPEQQVKVFQNLFGNPRFTVVFQFYAAFTKLQTEGIGDILASTVQREQEKYSSERTLLVDLLHCLYEAQDLSLCRFVTSQLNGVLDLSGSTLSPVDCLSVGYFLTSVCLSTSGRFKAVLLDCSLDDYRVSLLTKEISKHCHCIDTGSGSAMGSGCLEVDLDDNNITGVGMYSLGELIRSSSMIVSLNLERCESVQEGEDGLYHLSNALMTNTSLIELRLGTVKVTDRSGEALSKMLCTNQSLKTLTFWSLSDYGAYYIAQGLSQNCSLEQLEVCVGITSLGARYLGIALTVNNSLKVLTFSGEESNAFCSITGSGAARLASSLTVNTALEELNLSGNEVGDIGATQMGCVLRHNHTLKKLGLSGCGITDIGLQALAHGLEGNDSLEELDLVGNKVGDTGATHIGYTLRHNHTLKRLDLVFCEITDIGSQELADGLEANDSLEELNLVGNEVGESGAIHIGYALRHNHTLKKLDLRRCEITDIGLQALVHGLEGNDKLEELDLRWNKVGDTGATHIGYALRHNHTLKKLVLGYCELTDIGLQELAHGFEANDSLEELNLHGGE